MSDAPHSDTRSLIPDPWAERAAVCAEARSWVGTPYHHCARVKGPQGGVDCAQIIWAVFHAVGLTPFMPLEPYARDWFLHRSAEQYMGIVLDRAHPVEAPLPGDVVLYKVGRCFAHGGIIVDPGWPTIVHAYARARRVLVDDGSAGEFARRERRFFSRWGAIRDQGSGIRMMTNPSLIPDP